MLCKGRHVADRWFLINGGDIGWHRTYSLTSKGGTTRFLKGGDPAVISHLPEESELEHAKPCYVRNDHHDDDKPDKYLIRALFADTKG